MPRAIPPRLLWAAERLQVQPHDIILEMGCATGVALKLIWPRLTLGLATGIDSSASAIAGATRRLAPGIAQGKVRLIHADLTVFRPERPFTKVFAVNVNAFWTAPAKAMEALNHYLEPGGTAYLFYHQPSLAQLEKAVERTSAHLREAGFAVHSVERRDLGTLEGAVVIANRGPAAPATPLR